MSQLPEQPEYVGTAEAARRLGLKPHTLRVWRMKGNGPAYVRLGGPRGRAIYKRADLDEFLKSRTHRSTTEESAKALLNRKPDGGGSR